jgi:hypothetical protein
MIERSIFSTHFSNSAVLMCAEVNVLWAAHQVHHSSEEYNLSTALRQSAFQAFGSFVSTSTFIMCVKGLAHREMTGVIPSFIAEEIFGNTSQAFIFLFIKYK